MQRQLKVNHLSPNPLKNVNIVALFLPIAATWFNQWSEFGAGLSVVLSLTNGRQGQSLETCNSDIC